MTSASRAMLDSFDFAYGGEVKTMPLAEALSRAVRPKMTLHFGFSHNRPSAAMVELIRQFRGKDPKFTFLLLFTSGPAIAFLTEGLCERLVTTLVLEPYPAPGPSKPAQRAHKRGQFAIEHWSVLGYTARLEAAARGLDAMPIRGLFGTTMALENGHAMRPRAESECVEVLPMVPDLSIVHAPCADRFGNVLFSPPLAEGLYGAYAAKEGVVVTVERIVPPEVIRRHSHLLGLPSQRVKSVSVVPFGAHPAGLASGGIDEVEPYGDDVAFYASAREAGQTEDGWRAWVDRFILGPKGHEEYLERVGADRLMYLKGKARADSWRVELVSAASQLAGEPSSATPLETMILAASDLIDEKTRKEGLDTVLSGLGAANLAAWMAFVRAYGEGRVAPMLVAELGMAGYLPRPCDPYLFNFRNLATCSLRADSLTALGLLVGGSQARSLGSLGAAQVDATGAYNSTRLLDGTLIVGSGGGSDVASGATEVIVTLPVGKHRLVEELPYVTGRGDRVTAVVTDLGVFDKPIGKARLRLTRLTTPLVDDAREPHIEKIRKNVGFSFDVAPERELVLIRPADAPRLNTLRIFDPARSFL